MPIRECNKARYPADWKQISLRIRERDGNKCKWCGVPNAMDIIRYPDRTWRLADSTDWEDYAVNGEDKPVKIVLTVAHLDHVPENVADSNLVALCQRCHLNYDRRQHVSNSAETRRLKLEAVGQRSLLEMGSA